MSGSVCLSVDPLARITRKPHDRTSPNVCECCLRPRLGLPLARSCDRLCTSGFVDDVMLSYYGADKLARIKHDVMFRRSSPGGGTSWSPRQLQRLVEFIRMQHRRRNPISTIDLLYVRSMLTIASLRSIHIGCSARSRRIHTGCVAVISLRIAPQRAASDMNELF